MGVPLTASKRKMRKLGKISSSSSSTFWGKPQTLILVEILNWTVMRGSPGIPIASVW